MHEELNLTFVQRYVMHAEFDMTFRCGGSTIEGLVPAGKVCEGVDTHCR